MDKLRSSDCEDCKLDVTKPVDFTLKQEDNGNASMSLSQDGICYDCDDIYQIDVEQKENGKVNVTLWRSELYQHKRIKTGNCCKMETEMCVISTPLFHMTSRNKGMAVLMKNRGSYLVAPEFDTMEYTYEDTGDQRIRFTYKAKLKAR